MSFQCTYKLTFLRICFRVLDHEKKLLCVICIIHLIFLFHLFLINQIYHQINFTNLLYYDTITPCYSAYTVKKTHTSYTLIPINADYAYLFSATHEHYHKVYHLIVVTQGTGRLEFSNEILELEERTAVLTNPMEKHIFHSLDSHKNIPLKFFSFNFYLIENSQISIPDNLDNYLYNIQYIDKISIQTPLEQLFNIDVDTHSRLLYNPDIWSMLCDIMSQSSLNMSRFKQSPVVTSDTEFSKFINSFSIYLSQFL